MLNKGKRQNMNIILNVLIKSAKYTKYKKDLTNTLQYNNKV